MKRLVCLFLSIIVTCSMASIASAADKTEKVVLPYMLTMNAAEDRKMVQDAINAITVDKIGVEVELVCIDFASWSTQLNLMLTDGSADLFNCCFMSPLATYVDNGSLLELDDLLTEYGQGIVECLGDYINCGKINGVQYGVPKVDAYSNRPVVVMDAEICEALGITADDIHNFDDLTNVALKVKEAYPDLPIFPTGTNGDFMDPIAFDGLGTGGHNMFGALDLTKNDLNVVNVFETEAFEKLVEICNNWQKLGLFIDDPLNAQDGAVAYLSNRQAFCYLGGGFDPDVTAEVQQNNCGMKLIGSELTQTNYATTSSVSGMTWCIPALSQHPEAAMKLLNELYCNPDLANLVCSGIEGVHYVVTEDGTVTFAEGLDAFNTGWPSGMGTFWPNITITRPWAPNSADYYETWIASNNEATLSPAMGFTFDASNVGNEIAACTNVVAQYYNTIMLGLGDTDALLAEFRAELKAAGIDTIIAEKQAQLNDWAATK